MTYKKVIIGTVSKTIVSLDVGVFLVSRLLSLNIDRLLVKLHLDVPLNDVDVRLFQQAAHLSNVAGLNHFIAMHTSHRFG